MADSPSSNATDPCKNVYYISFNPNTDQESPELRAKLEAVRNNVNLNNQFLDFKANSAVKQKVDHREIRDDDIPRSNYKAKALSHLTSNVPWSTELSSRVLTRTFDVKKEDFHAALVSQFTEGLDLPAKASINTQFEGVLENMKKAIQDLSDVKNSNESLTFFILMAVYQKDDVAQAWQPVIRTIYLRADRALSEFIKKKKDTWPGTNVNVSIEYLQRDGIFKDRMFEESAKTAIQSLGRDGVSVTGCKWDIAI